VPTPEQTARIKAAEELAAALVGLWLMNECDDIQRRRIAVFTDDVVFADLQAEQYRSTRVALAPIVDAAPSKGDDGGCTNPHGVRSEAAVHLRTAIEMSQADRKQRREWSRVCAALDVLWPASSSQARAICGVLLPSQVEVLG
jgi:hypothetical protein